MKMRGILFFTGIALFVAWMVTRIVMGVQLDQQFTGHLKRAADANQIELAEREMNTAVSYLERNNLTTGYTSIMWQTPDEDIEFFYKNLKGSYDELASTPDTASNLEVSNQLIKLRETLLDHGKESDSVTCPDGLSVYPANTLFMLWGLSSLLLIAFSALSFIIEEL